MIALSKQHAATLLAMARHFRQIAKVCETDVTTEQQAAYEALSDALRRAEKEALRR